MADDPQIGQEEIEALLKQAQNEAAGEQKAEKPDEPSEPTAADALGQEEIEALLKSGGANPAGAQQSGDAQAKPAAPAPKGKKQAQKTQDDDIEQADIDLLLRQAEAAIASVNEPNSDGPPVQQFRLRDFAGAPPSSERSTLELIRDVELDLKIELGRTHMPLEEVLKLRKGSVVPLDKLAGDPVDIYVNGRLIARGEVLVLNDNFCVRVAELIASEAVA